MIQEDRSRWRRGLGAVGLVAVFCVLAFAIPHFAYADVWDDIRNALLNFLGYILLFIAGVLGKLVMLVVNGLIGVAQYNEFVSSQPVTIGWPLVRDVVNMFFIVVLLVIAFSTIIGYEPFHYKKVLPKLLLMAILINFSKTLLGLLIDFSQVLVLTFVTAFKQAAAGNFVTALKLDKVFKLQNGSNQEPKDIIGAIFLAVILLGVMLSAVLIMLVFMVFRIVGLWILLIMSPIAFFALALPEKMSKGVKPFTDDFWSRLSTLLIAGPAMAFFLWLSLAIASGPTPFAVGNAEEINAALSQGSDQGSNNPSAAINFSSAVGNPADITTFVVAIMLMLQGVEFGLQSAGSISKALGGALKQYVSPGALARGAARVSGRAISLTARGADALSGGRISKTVGRAGLKVAARLPGAIGAETFAGLAGRRQRMVAEQTKRLGGITKNLSAGDAMSFLEARSGSLTLNRFEKAAAEQKNGEIAMSKPGLEALKAKRLLSGEGLVGSKNRQVTAEALALGDARDRLTKAYATAEANGDTEAMKTIEDRMASNPGLMGKKELKKLAMETIKSPKEVLQTKNAEAFRSVQAAVAATMAAGMMNDDGTINEQSEGRTIMKKNGGGEREKVFQEFMKSTTAEQRAAVAATFRGNASKAQVDLAASVDGYIGKDATTGAYTAVAFATGQTMGETPGAARQPGFRERSADKTMQNIGVQAMVDLDKLKVEGPAAYYGEQGQNARNDAVRSGRDLTQIFNFNAASGEFAKAEDRNAFASSMTQFVDKVANKDADAAKTIVNMDLSMMKEAPNEFNEARSTFVASLHPIALGDAYKNAKEANDTEMQKKLGEIAEIIRTEAARTNQIVSKAKVSSADLARFSVDQNFPTRQAVVTRIVEAGAGTEARAIDAAKAIYMAKAIENDEQFRELRGVIGKRAQRTTQNRRQSRVTDDDDDNAVT